MARKQRWPTQSGSRAAAAVGLDAQVGRDFREAVEHLKAGRLQQSAEAHRRVLARAPRHAPSLHNLGLIAFKSNAPQEAIDYIRRSLEADPKHHQAWLNLALLLGEARRLDEAIAACQQCLALQPASAKPHAVLGDLLRSARNAADAVTAYGESLRREPKQPAVLVKMGELLMQGGSVADALACCRRALALDPGHAAAQALERRILATSGQLDALLAEIDAQGGDPAERARRWDEIGALLCEQKRFDEAVTLYRRAVAALPERADLHFHLAQALEGAGQKREALTAYQAGLALAPERADAYVKVGLLLRSMDLNPGAVTAFAQAAKLAPDLADAHYNLAVTCKLLGRYDEACGAFRQAIACAPDALIHRFELCNTRRMACDWDGLEAEEQDCLRRMRETRRLVAPFLMLPMPSTLAEQLEASRRFAQSCSVPDERKLRGYRTIPEGGRIRVGYLSSDFYSHATAILLAEVIEQTDRTRFELFAYCHSRDDGSDMRKRIVAAFDHFVPVGGLSSQEAARRIHADGIDILVDLKGYTQNARTDILAYRPAPIQVNYLGYPGTMGADFIDYIVADPVVVPMSHQECYDERIVHLPHCYQPNDRQRRIADEPVTRARFGLPEDAFVFCSFNNIYKLDPTVFGIWMRLLAGVPNSVLWILGKEQSCRDNLRREAAARGIDPARLVFADHCSNELHLARHRLADLFLDTLRYNAHTTASDALWAGLPLVTCLGEAFSGRVAASLLTAMGLEELITDSLEAYERTALTLAQDKDRLAAIKRKILENRETSPLFDSLRYTRNLERAYETMISIMKAGEAPRAFAVVEPEPASATPAAPAAGPIEARVPYTVCPVCDGGDIPYQIEARVSAHPLYRPELPPTVKWRCCAGCGHVFTEGHLTAEARDLVLATTLPHQQVGNEAAAGRAAAARIVSRVARHAPDGEWLDVGAGNGALLFTAAEWGYGVVGTDLRIDNVEMLLRLGFMAVWNDIEDMEGRDRFSVISMADALPQAAFPRQRLAAAHRLLKTGGALFVAMPNMDTVVWRILDASGANPYWGEIAHAHIFTRARLVKLLEAEGFRVVEYNIGEPGPTTMEMIAVKL